MSKHGTAKYYSPETPEEAKENWAAYYKRTITDKIVKGVKSEDGKIIRLSDGDVLEWMCCHYYRSMSTHEEWYPHYSHEYDEQGSEISETITGYLKIGG